MLMKRKTREQVAELLKVTPARVSQIAKELDIGRQWSPELGFFYSGADVLRMVKRNTKPGPKKNGARK